MPKAEWGISDGKCDFCGEDKRIVVYSKPDKMFGGNRDSAICRVCLMIILTGYDLINVDML